MSDKLLLLKQSIGKFTNAMKRDGVLTTIKKANSRLMAMSGMDRMIYKENKQIPVIYNEILRAYHASEIKGVKIITSALEFDEVYNQRTINLAKYLADQNHAVIYVVWQFDTHEKLEKNYQKVYKNIYQIPMYDLIYGLEQLDILNDIQDKTFITTFPAKAFHEPLEVLKKKNYITVYDNMDEWEEFFKVGHAPWYKKEIEEQIIKNSNFVFAVSEPLKQKFSYIRDDIYVIGNGFQESLSKKENVALRTEAGDKKVHIGYFGHLTDSWFDYALIFALAENKQNVIHLVGHGVPDHLLDRISKSTNIKYYGKVHPSELYEFVSNWHVGIIPFKHSKLSEAVDPIKIYEYLYFGLPTVSTGIPHIGEYPYVIHANTYSDVQNAISTLYISILNSEIRYEELKDFLHNSTWEKRFERMHEIINKNSKE
ncbi:glycosyltransferase [Fredinandcohnia sp. 179-A 10B2 NHS]|uniref:glycosyltransferase n=1 Tax=Fredinandcohnia sp. 179-A 10B2 NHS TaxID=3235176 RepID=UPI0039A327CF